MTDQIRITLLDTAQRAVSDLAKEVNGLLETAHFFIERYQQERPFVCKEVADTSVLVAARFKEVTERVVGWKMGTPPVLSRLGFKLNVMNELGINCNLLYHLFTTAGIEVDCSPHIFKSTSGELLHCDQILSR